MCPCSPSDLTVNIPSGPVGPAIPGFGQPFALPLPDFNIKFPEGFPENLQDIFNKLQLALPSGIIKPAINPNFGKDIFDGIMSLMDNFIPFFMLYKFFLPLLELIICIIEVLCAVPNPFKLPKALQRLFRVCLPNFLAMFPIFALIAMLLSLLFLVLALIDYILAEIEKLINLLLRNIRVIQSALTKADSPSILAAINKIAMVLCAFQNLFVLFSIFNIILGAIKDVLAMLFAIPPCDDNNNNDEKCCTPDVCPSFIKNNDGMTRNTGTFEYFNAVGMGVESLPSGFPTGFPLEFFNTNYRNELWQLYDAQASVPDAFWNITRAYDLPPGFSQIFFPTDVSYSFETPYKQAPYNVDLTLDYDPLVFGRIDPKGARKIKVKNCIVLIYPVQYKKQFDNSIIFVKNGILSVAGGTAYELDDTQIFVGDEPATLNNFFHQDKTIVYSTPVLLPGITQTNVEYTFHINYEVLIQKAMITLGCMPVVALDRQFINSIFGGGSGAVYAQINNLINGGAVDSNGNQINFPDINGVQNCLTTALNSLRNNISLQGVADFKATSTICLNNLKNDATNSINALIGLGYDPYKSELTLEPSIQFTTSPIIVKVALKENNGQSITTGLPVDLAQSLSKRLQPTITFGQITDFNYDGYNYFTAEITSNISGTGNIQVSFDGNTISTVNVPTDLTVPPTVTPVILPYKFVYSPAAGEVPRRDEGDTSRASGDD